jgi:phosphate/sulfate permease
MRVAIYRWRKTPYAVDSLFRYLQFVSAFLYSLGHGGNDAQKTMGIIAGAQCAPAYIRYFRSRPSLLHCDRLTELK